MDNINEFKSKDFMTASEKEEMCQHHRWDQLRDELQTSYSSEPELEPECLDSKSEHSQECELEIKGLVDGNLPFRSKPYVAPEFEPLNMCTINQVLAKDSSVLP